jgi:mannan endo-1,4-beta-mannosidase
MKVSQRFAFRFTALAALCAGLAACGGGSTTVDESDPNAIASEGAEGRADRIKPILTVTAPTTTGSVTTTGKSIVLSGSARDNRQVARITWVTDKGSSGRATQSGASDQVTWSSGTIVLPEGASRITVRAYDRAGNVASQSVAVTVVASTAAPAASPPAATAPAPAASSPAAPAPSPAASAPAPAPAVPTPAGSSPVVSAPAPAPSAPAPTPAASSSAQGTTTARAAYYVDQGKLLDPCGVEVVPRGVNKMAVYADRAGNSFPEIAKTGANMVRFMWLTEVPASEAVQTLQRAVDSKLIPVWELHDATGDFSKMSTIDAYWNNPATVAVLRQFESHVIVNLANEAGDYNVSDSTFTSTYSSIIAKLRNAGLRMPFMIDAAGWGRNVEQLLRVAPAILAADPLKNVIFSWHQYDVGPDQPARVANMFSTAVTQKIPLLVGEFGPVSAGACSQAVDYQTVMSQAQSHGLGYLAWSWDNNNGDCITSGGSAFDMVADGINLSTLKSGFATVVTLSHAASIQKTSVRTHWQNLGRCTP